MRSDTAHVREWVLGRRRLTAELAAHQASLQANPPARQAIWRCTKPHKNGSPMLAQAVSVDGGVLFAARIKWLPSDQLNLRGWMREHLLSTLTDQGLEDNLLSTFLDHLEEWGTGQTPHGERWLRGMPDHFVRDFYLPEPQIGELQPWMRCVNHPDGAEVAARNDMFSATR